MYSNYDNMHKNEIFYALICINNQIISCLNYILSKRKYFSYSLKIILFYFLSMFSVFWN